MNRAFLDVVAAELTKLDVVSVLAWTVEDVPNEEMRKDYAHLVAGPGEFAPELEVWLGRPQGSKDQRFVIRPIWPRSRREYYRPREAQGEITLAAGAAPGRVASEIARRLLPNYLAQLADAVARVERDRAAFAQRDAIGALIGQKWDVQVRSYPNRNPETDEELRAHLPFGDTFDADVVLRPFSGAKFTVELKDPAQVGLLADVLRKLWEASTEAAA